ncbi:MAG: metallophosphoesterase [Candidatus Eisenbacteria bacterium]
MSSALRTKSRQTPGRHDGAVPRYRGGSWSECALPTRAEAWPKFGTRALRDLSGDDYDITREDLRTYSQGKIWVWPAEHIFFLCDVHADTEAFLRCLVATGGIERTGAGDTEYALTEVGRSATFVIGGDCFDKGPENLRLLRALGGLIDKGARVEILAGNHDVRALLGLAYAGEKSPRTAHLWVRMGKKSIPLFREIYDQYLTSMNGRIEYPTDEEVRARLFPPESWFDEFPAVAAGLILPQKIEREIVRIREKMVELVERAAEMGMTLGQVYVATQLAQRLFLQPNGEFRWFFERMRLARRAGSFLMIHAGVDDETAALIHSHGVEGLNDRFRELVEEDLWELYHGPVGNAFRTKYRDADLPLTEGGTELMHRSGIYAIVHGHKNLLRGPRLTMRRGILNVECDSSVDCNTRRLEGLAGPGAAALVIRPDGQMIALSVDYPYAKVFTSSRNLHMVIQT